MHVSMHSIAEQKRIAVLTYRNIFQQFPSGKQVK